MTLTSYYHSLPSQVVPSENDFYMYIFKVKRCTKTKSHDWTSCPFLHKGEKARRRDPQKYHYSAEMCPGHRAKGVRRLVEGSSGGDQTVRDGLGVRRSVVVVDAERDEYYDVDWVAELVE
ncbi:hypothetical protein Sjap_004516 [Stephania japonica]|uniref:AtC3H23-like CCCH zinc finger domain-containing protein n=1 Tax=Stephania japonica TaxID=461633 RepID=A0AAP0K2E0_9MAGN